jgi:hypothetical protein
LQDNDQNDPADATNVQGNMVQGSDGSVNELDGPVANMENVGVATTETRTGSILDDDSDNNSVENVVINITDATRDDDSSKWPHFDVVKSPQDHHYLDTIEQVGTCTKTFFFLNTILSIFHLLKLLFLSKYYWDRTT